MKGLMRFGIRSRFLVSSNNSNFVKYRWRFDCRNTSIHILHHMQNPLHLLFPSQNHHSTRFSEQRLEYRIQRWPSSRTLHLRLIPQNLLNLIQNLRRKLRNNLKRLKVINNLLRFGSTKDNSTRAGFLSYPSQREVVQFTSELCQNKKSESEARLIFVLILV